MHILETNDWVIFNNLTYQIHKIHDFDEMCRNFLGQMRLLLHFDAAVFYYSSAQELPQLSHAICLDYPEKAAQEYLTHAQRDDLSYGLLLGGKSMVYRDSDVFSDEEWTHSICCRCYVRDLGFHHCVTLLPAEDGKVLAKITFYRKNGELDYRYEDLFLLDMLKEHLALRIARHYEESARQHEKLTVQECREAYRLTARETTILSLLMQGLSNEVICNQLTITNNTLKKHILNIYKKLHIRNRTQLFKLVREYSD